MSRGPNALRGIAEKIVDALLAQQESEERPKIACLNRFDSIVFDRDVMIDNVRWTLASLEYEE